jgi:hypothetical protein
MWVSFLDPLREQPDRWGLSSTPSAAGRVATIPELFGGQGAVLAIANPGGDDLSEAMLPSITCEGDNGEQLQPASAAFTVDDVGAIQSFEGYGDPDNPAFGPCDWVV